MADMSNKEKKRDIVHQDIILLSNHGKHDAHTSC